MPLWRQGITTGDPRTSDEAIRLDSEERERFETRGNAMNEKGEAEAAFADFDAAINRTRVRLGLFQPRQCFRRPGRERACCHQDYDTAIISGARNVNAYLARGVVDLATRRGRDRRARTSPMRRPSIARTPIRGGAGHRGRRARQRRARGRQWSARTSK